MRGCTEPDAAGQCVYRCVERIPRNLALDGVPALDEDGVLYVTGRRTPFSSVRGEPGYNTALYALRSDDLVPRSVRRKNTRLEQERITLSFRWACETARLSGALLKPIGGAGLLARESGVRGVRHELECKAPQSLVVTSHCTPV